jgi:hypothetical protein
MARLVPTDLDEADRRGAISLNPAVSRHSADNGGEVAQQGRALQSLSLGNVAAMNPQVNLPRKYRTARPGEKSTFQGAGVVPVTRMPDGEVRILLWQPQSGRKKGVRWYDFGGRKENAAEFTSTCACRKFAKQTYGVFGCEIELSDNSEHLNELYQGLANLPLMLRSSREWAKMQLLDETSRIFYSDIHEYHAYMLIVPYVPEEVLNKVSQIVDGGKRVFKWLNREEVKQEVLAPRLHTESFTLQIEKLPDDAWIKQGTAYGDGAIRVATGCFSGKNVA